MNWNMVLLRGLKVPVGLCALAFGFAFAVRQLAISTNSIELFRMAGWVAFSGLGVLVVGSLAFAWRLHKWERGKGPACQYCSGPQGGEQDGKVIRGKLLPDYRTCYNCGRHSPVETG